MMEELRHNRGQQRFEAWIEGRLAGEITYALLPGDVADLNHTFVNESARGTGLAGRLARFAFDEVRAGAEWKIRPTCPYVIGWSERHPEYADLLVGAAPAD